MKTFEDARESFADAEGVPSGGESCAFGGNGGVIGWGWVEAFLDCKED